MNQISMISSIWITNSRSLSKFGFSHFCRLFLILLDSCWHSLLISPCLAHDFLQSLAKFWTTWSQPSLSAMTCIQTKTKHFHKPSWIPFDNSTKKDELFHWALSEAMAIWETWTNRCSTEVGTVFRVPGRRIHSWSWLWYQNWARHTWDTTKT